MALRSAGRKLSYEILSQTNTIEEADAAALFNRSNSDPIHNHGDHHHHQSTLPAQKLNRKKRKKRKKTMKTIEIESSIPEDPITENGPEFDSVSVSDSFRIAEREFSVSGNGENYSSNGMESNCEGYKFVRAESVGSVCTVTTVTEPGFQNMRGELRQRGMNGSGGDGGLEDSASKVESGVKVSSAGKQRSEPNGTVLTKLETVESLDWKRLMAEDPNCELSLSFSLSHFVSFLEGGKKEGKQLLVRIRKCSKPCNIC